MTWKNIREEILKLGFEDYDVYSEDKDLFIHSVNRAINLIVSTVRPILRRYEIVHGTPKQLVTSAICRYDLSELTKTSGGKVIFQDFDYSKPLLYTNLNPNAEDYNFIDDYTTEDRKILVIDTSKFNKYLDSAVFTVWYKKIPERITTDTPDDFEMELDYDIQVLLPLLSAHYIWLDDEERKAMLYWNEYDSLRFEILMSSTEKIVHPKLVNRTGWW